MSICIYKSQFHNINDNVFVSINAFWCSSSMNLIHSSIMSRRFAPLTSYRFFLTQIVVSILVPVGIQLLEFKSEAEMSHVPQSQEALQFGRDTGGIQEPETEDVMEAVSETCSCVFFLISLALMLPYLSIIQLIHFILC